MNFNFTFSQNSGQQSSNVSKCSSLFELQTDTFSYLHIHDIIYMHSNFCITQSENGKISGGSKYFEITSLNHDFIGDMEAHILSKYDNQ